MEQITRYRVPLLTAVGAVVLVIVVFAAWISPEGSKLSSLQARQTQLQSQQAHIQAELVTLRSEKAHQVANCQQLTSDLTEIPGTPTVDDFFHQITTLAVSSGDPNTPSISVTEASGGTGGTKDVSVTMQLQGTYGQMTSFLQGLQSFPRLFTIGDISVTGGAVAGQAVNSSTAGYSLSLTGDIYYSAGQADVCSGNAATTAAP